jgi:uncharacterized protein YjaZ
MFITSSRRVGLNWVKGMRRGEGYVYMGSLRGICVLFLSERSQKIFRISDLTTSSINFKERYSDFKLSSLISAISYEQMEDILGHEFLYAHHSVRFATPCLTI